MDRDFVTIVSGLPRSGTSMMMQMLQAGGIPLLTDDVRPPDQDNPRGYLEYAPVKNTTTDPSWLAGAGGKAVKMVYRLLYDLPRDRSYRVVFMQRDMQEVLVSQRKMLDRLGRPGGVGDEEMGRLFESQLKEFRRWVATRRRFSVLYLEYGQVIRDGLAQSRRISEFLGGGLDTTAMAAVVDRALYRVRKADPWSAAE